MAKLVTWQLGSAIAGGALISFAVFWSVGSLKSADLSCDRYFWPKYPAECLSSEDGAQFTKEGRAVVPRNTYERGQPVSIVSARQSAPIHKSPADADNRSPPSGKSVVRISESHHDGLEELPTVNIDEQQPTIKSSTNVISPPVDAGHAVVVVWRGSNRTAYLVPKADK
jgi:hypothetical protein